MVWLTLEWKLWRPSFGELAAVGGGLYVGSEGKGDTRMAHKLFI